MMSPDDVLKKLENQEREIELEGIKVIVRGLTFPELAHLAPHMDRNNTEYVLKYITKRTIEKAFPEWTEKQVEVFLERINPKYLIKIVNIVKEISMPDDALDGDVKKKVEAPKGEQ